MDTHTGNAVSARPAPRRPRIAVVDLDRRVQSALAEALRVAGLDVIGTAGESGTALNLVATGADVLVIDPRLPDLADGHALMARISRQWPEIRIVIIGWGDSGESPVGNNVVATFVTKSARAEDFVAATLAACQA
jgi:DNA-binding NarL/FixJ family response regulator